MSLEQLRAQAEAEETKATEAEQPEAEEEATPVDSEEESDEEEAKEAESQEPEAEEAEESEDFELELDGEPEPDQQKPSPEEALVYKLTKQKQKTREYKTELEELKAEIAALKSGQSQPQPQSQPTRYGYPPIPVLYENGIETPEQYQQAYFKWEEERKAIDKRQAEAEQQQSEHKRQMEEMTLNMAKRVSKFATEHKMSGDYVANAVERARQEVEDATGIEGSLAYMLDAVGEGSEKVALWLGTDRGVKDMDLIKDLLAKDKSGLKAIAHMTRIAARKPAQKRTSKAPEPDQPLRGDGSSKSARKLQEEYDKASSKMDMGKMRELKRKAESIGVKLN